MMTASAAAYRATVFSTGRNAFVIQTFYVIFQLLGLAHLLIKRLTGIGPGQN